MLINCNSSPSPEHRQSNSNHLACNDERAPSTRVLDTTKMCLAPLLGLRTAFFRNLLTLE
eukprot:3880272-Amphidinium_carterae.1